MSTTKKKKRLTRNKFPTVHVLTVDEVVDLDTLIDFLNSRVGTPRPLAKEKGGVSKQATTFFESYPNAEWRALTDLATWAKVKNKHLSMVQLVGSWRYAYEDGFMNILMNNSSTNDEITLQELLKTVDDEGVRRRMIGASTATERDQIYQTFRDTFDDIRDVDIHKDDTDPLADYGLATGQAVKVRMSAADIPEVGTIVGLTGTRLDVYLKGQTVPVPLDLVQVRQDGEWENLL